MTETHYKALSQLWRLPMINLDKNLTIAQLNNDLNYYYNTMNIGKSEFDIRPMSMNHPITTFTSLQENDMTDI